jgi:flagellar biosynthesis protein FlhB
MISRRKSSKISEFIKELFQEKDFGAFAIKILKIIGVVLLICIVVPIFGMLNALKYVLERALNILSDIWKHVYKLLILAISVLVFLFIAAVIADRLGCPWLYDLASSIIFR